MTILGGVLAVIVFFGAIVGCMAGYPQYKLYKSNTEKQSVIREQEAISEAAVYAAQKRVTEAEANADAALIAATAEAERRIIEAESIAASQELIAATLTAEYLQWRYYEVLSTTDGQVIYVPTEAGLPITEAGRNTPTTTVAP